MDNFSRGHFHIEIHSIEDFVIFCALLRGGDLDSPDQQAKINALVAQLKGSTDALAKDVADKS